MKKLYRYFGGCLDRQENWLNRMAQKGYRLVNTGKLVYEFEPANPEEYQYAIEFIAHKSVQTASEYTRFLEDTGHRVFHKNVNLNCSIGKVRWRPYGEGLGQIATNPGSYNKELLIVEKKNDGTPFALHTTHADRANYYKPIRNAWFTTLLLVWALFGLEFFRSQRVSPALALFTILGLLCMIPMVRYQKRIITLSQEATIEE